MEFQFQLKVKNLGRIKEAEIALNNFTVFAGLNNSGKSYVSRFIYSLLDSLNMNLTHAYLERMSKSLDDSTPSLRTNLRIIGKLHEEYAGKSSSISDLLEQLFELERQAGNLLAKVKADLRPVNGNGDGPGNANSEAEDIIKQHIKPLKQKLDGIEEVYTVQTANFDAEKISKPSDKKHYLSSHQGFKQGLSLASEACSNLANIERAANDADSIQRTYEYILSRNLLGNFQFKKLAHLIGADKSKAAFVELRLPGSAERKISCSIIPDAAEVSLDYGGEQSVLDFLKSFARVIYLESPVYWKLEKPLDRAQIIPLRFISDEQDSFLSGVPKYFADLEEAMQYPRKGVSEIDFDVEQIVGGKIIRDSREVLVYKEKETAIEYPLTATATGIIQLAFIAYLVDTQVIKRNAVVFIDEPEAHLHPKWQRTMMKSLGKLARQGVNVVFATHSPNNIQWLQAEMNQADDFADNVALNHFTANGKFRAGLPRDVCHGVLEDLTDDFTKEFVRSL